MKKMLAFALLVSMCQPSAGQVSFTAMPLQNQLYARTLPGDSGTVDISGTVNDAGVDYAQIRLKVYRDNAVVTTLTQPLSFNGNSAGFTFGCNIKAELAMYKFEVYGVNGTQESLVRSADSVVCGDVYMIMGQSNAEACMRFNSSSSAIISPFIRVFGSGNYNGSDSVWRVGQGDGNLNTPGNTGQWGLKMARLIVDNHHIPVAIFNGAHGGMMIEFFQKNVTDPYAINTNYGRMMIRTHLTKLAPHIKAIFWHQGENNSDGTPTATYMDYFRTLRAAWLTDYPNVKKFYLFQIRNGCGHTLPNLGLIKEAQRRLGLEVPGLEIMSTSAQDHGDDNCHYTFGGGFESFGENIYRLVNRDFYNGVNDTDNIEPPSIKYAEISGTNEITLLMRNALDSIRYVSGSGPDFVLENTGVTVTGGSVSGHRVRLSLSGNPAGITSISYLGHENTADPLLLNLKGVGALHFYKFPLTTPRYRDSVAVATLLQVNGITLPVDSVATFSPGGRVTELKVANRNITLLPVDIVDLDNLNSLDLSGNLLTSLPREIVKLNPGAGVNIDGNRLCDLTGNLLTWVNYHSANSAWQSSQKCTAPVFSKLRISPDPLLCSPGQVDTFTVQALDQYGAVMASQPSISWTASDANITEQGYYTAPMTKGQYHVIVSAGSIRDTAWVAVSASLTKLKPGVITRMLVLARNGSPYTSRGSGNTIDSDFTGKDATITPSADSTAQIGGNTLGWDLLDQDKGVWFGDVAQDSFIAYGALYLFAPEPRTVYLAYSHDDDVLVRLNNEVVAKAGGWTANPQQPELLAPCHLVRGVNKFVFKLIEGYGGNYLTVRFTDNVGSDLRDLYVQYTPDSLTLQDLVGARRALSRTALAASPAIRLLGAGLIGVRITEAGRHTISVFTLNGRLASVKTVTVPGEYLLRDTRRATGVYFVNVTGPGKSSTVKKIVNMRTR
jgi:hypothetical protein